MNGFDALSMLRTVNFEEQVVLGAAVRRASEMAVERDQRLAQMIRSEIIEAWNKGQS